MSAKCFESFKYVIPYQMVFKGKESWRGICTESLRCSHVIYVYSADLAQTLMQEEKYENVFCVFCCCYLFVLGIEVSF